MMLQVVPSVKPWPVVDVPWGLNEKFYRLGAMFVIDDPHKWEGPKLILRGGTRASFKFLHKKKPIISSCHFYDYEVIKRTGQK